MATSSSAPAGSHIASSNENWYRIASLIYDAVLPAMISALHNDNHDPSFKGLPRDPTDLYNEFNITYKKKLMQLIGRKLINQDQYDILLPLSGQTDSSSFDVSLTYAVIRNLLKLPTKCRWNYDILVKQNPVECSTAAYVIRGKELRNFLSHNVPNSVTSQMLSDKWKEGEEIVKGLGYTACDLNALFQAPLDGQAMATMQTRLRSDEAWIKAVEQRVEVLEDRVQVLETKVPDIRKLYISTSPGGSVHMRMKITLQLKNAFWRQVTDADFDVRSHTSVQLKMRMEKFFREETPSGEDIVNIEVTQDDCSVEPSFFNGTRVKYELHYKGLDGSSIPLSYSDPISADSMSLQSVLEENIKKSVKEKFSCDVDVSFPGWGKGSLKIVIAISKEDEKDWLDEEAIKLERLVASSASGVDLPLVLDSIKDISRTWKLTYDLRVEVQYHAVSVEVEGIREALSTFTFETQAGKEIEINKKLPDKESSLKGFRPEKGYQTIKASLDDEHRFLESQKSRHSAPAKAEQTNFFRMWVIIQELCTQMLREMLEHFEPAFSCPAVIRVAKGVKFTKAQQDIVKNISLVKSYKDCDITLLCILLRSIVAPEFRFHPTRPFGQKLTPTSIKPADDMERIRLRRNEIVVSVASVSFPAYQEFIGEMTEIMKRADSGYNGSISLSSAGTFVGKLNQLLVRPLDEKEIMKLRQEQEYNAEKKPLIRSLETLHVVFELQVSRPAYRFYFIPFTEYKLTEYDCQLDSSLYVGVCDAVNNVFDEMMKDDFASGFGDQLDVILLPVFNESHRSITFSLDVMTMDGSPIPERYRHYGTQKVLLKQLKTAVEGAAQFDWFTSTVYLGDYYVS